MNAYDLQCDFESLVFGYIEGPGCFSKNVNIENRNQILSSVNGKYFNDFYGSNKKMIEFSSQIVKFIPQLEKFFPNVEGLAIYNSKLQEVHQKDLAQLPKLKQLYLNYNELSSLPSDLFEQNLELLYIDFDGNRLKHIGKNLITHLNKLNEAWFSNNICIDKYASVQSKLSELSAAFIEKCSDFSQPPRPNLLKTIMTTKKSGIKN